MKKALLVILTLLAVVLVFAETLYRTEKINPLGGTRHSRTEVAAYQETFETGGTGWTFLAQTGANLWHIAQVADAPSPVNAMVNRNAQNTYNPGMMNFLISPSITLPLSGAIRADFMMKGNFSDPNYPGGTVPQLDYWGWQISPDNGATWRNMSNPYSTAPGFVFIDAPPTWSFVTESYAGLSGLITDFAGFTVRFRIYFRSDGDAPIGTGIMVDNFTIFNDIFLPSPSGLMATVVNQDVQLSWTAPPSGYASETITSTNSAWTSFVNDADIYAMKIVNPFPAQLQLSGVKFMLFRQGGAEIAGAPTVHVFSDFGGLPGNELVNVPNVSFIPNQSWKEVDISSHNVMIPAGGTIFVGISNIDDGGALGQGLLCDSTSTVANSFVMTQGSWDTLGNTYSGLRNCALAGTYWVDDPFAPILTSFKVYHALNINGPFSFIDTVNNPSTPSYLHETPVLGQVNHYRVTAIFDTYESDPSNTASVDLIDLLYTEISNDDGSSNQNFNLGTSAASAVRFSTQPDVQIFFAKVLLNAVGSSPMIVRIHDANGVGGSPGTMLLQYSVAVNNLSVGWNNLPLPSANIVTDPDGLFYISVVEFGIAPTFALDTDTSGQSWKKLTTAAPWTPITEGNVMIRALVAYGISNDEMVEILPVNTLSNYPNPFAERTVITFELTKSAPVNVRVYNLKGQLVRSLSSGNFAKGAHTLVWDGKDNFGRNVSMGIYYCKLEAEGKTLTRKLVRVK